MSEKSLKPEIRFAGFTENWEQHKAGEIFLTTTDKNHPELPVLSASQEYGMIKRDEAGINIYHDKRNETTYKRVLPGQFVIHLRSFQGGFAHSTIEGITSPAYTVLDFIEREKNYDFFWKYILNSELFVKRLETVTYGIRDGRSISYEDFTAMKFSYPDYDEQHKIGLFFKRLDNLIALHQHKCDKLVDFKKAMLEKMFPKDGADVPEIRFTGFTGSWERRKLGDICLIGDIDHKMPQSVIDGIPYIMTGDFIGTNDIDFKNSKLISTKDYERLAQKIKPEAGDILFARYASVGTVRYVETQIKFLVSYSCAILKHNGTTNGRYLFYYLQANEAQRQIKLEINTGSQRNIGIDSLKKLIVLLPQEREQEKVATFLTNLDNLITLHQRELEKLKNIKKSLLGKMFV